MLNLLINKSVRKSRISYSDGKHEVPPSPNVGSMGPHIVLA